MTIVRRSFKGQVAVLFACAAGAVIGALALTSDMTIMYMNWQALQKAADAAALMGGGGLPDDTAGARTAVTKSLQTNGVDPATELSSGYPTFANSNTEITVHLQRTVPHLFGRVVGLFSAPVQVSSTAQIQNAPSAEDIFPVGLDASLFPNLTFDGSQEYNVFSQSNHSAGGKGVLALGGVSDPYMYMDPANVFSGTLIAGPSDPLPVSTGCATGKASTPLGNRIAAGIAIDPPNGGTWNNHTPGNPLQVVIPFGTFSGQGSGAQFTISRFVNAWIDPANSSGCNINVFLIPGAAAGKGANGTVCTSSPSSPGFCQVVLIR